LRALSYPANQKLNLFIGYRTFRRHVTRFGWRTLYSILYLGRMILEIAENSPIQVGTVAAVMAMTVADDRAARVNNRLYVNIEAYSLETITINNSRLRELVVFA
jgi:hypothetical protein